MTHTNKHTEISLCTWNIACSGVWSYSKTSSWSVSVVALGCETQAELHKCRRETLWDTRCWVLWGGGLGCPKPLRNHRWAPEASSSFIIGRGGSEVALLTSGVGVAKKKKWAREEPGRELGNSFLHIVQISSSAESKNTVWKLTSDGGPESGGSKSAPILSWWNTILLTGQFQ